VTPAGRIDPPAWMAAAAPLLAALAGAGGRARFVGGCVRDAVAGRAVADVDIATDLTPGRVRDVLYAAGIKALPTGIAHGTITAIVEHRPFEVTTLRRDVETDGRHATVAFTDDWAEDAMRRDFTMNALYADPDGTLYDPAGGLADLAAGRVRFVGDAATRIAEDALRILRFFRFHARFGKGEPDAAGLDACAAAAAAIDRLSSERIAQEMRKLLVTDAAPQTLWLMAVRGILAHVSPDLGDLDRLERLVQIEREIGDADAVRRLAALLPKATRAAVQLSDRLKLSTRERDRLIALANPIARPIAARVELYRRGPGGFRDAVLLAGADGADWHAALAAVEGWTVPTLPVRGADLLAAGLVPGPALGRRLAEIEQRWIDSGFTLDRAALLAQP